MKVKIKEVTAYEYRYGSNLYGSKREMYETGKVFINPYLVTIKEIKEIESCCKGTTRKVFVLLCQQSENYYVLLEDIEDIIEIYW